MFTFECRQIGRRDEMIDGEKERPISGNVDMEMAATHVIVQFISLIITLIVCSKFKYSPNTKRLIQRIAFAAV